MTTYRTDGDGFISVDQFPGITQSEVIKNQRLCTVLALPGLANAEQIARIKLNCADATRTNASRASVPGSFSWHNTAYDVKLGPDGKTYVLNTDVSAVMKDNTVIPDTATTQAQVVAYANSIPLFTEQYPQPPVTGGPGQGALSPAAQAARAANQAAKGK